MAGIPCVNKAWGVFNIITFNEQFKKKKVAS